jgi:hypothetical protein
VTQLSRAMSCTCAELVLRRHCACSSPQRWHPDIHFSNLSKVGCPAARAESRPPGFSEDQALAAIREFIVELGQPPTADSWRGRE